MATSKRARDPKMTCISPNWMPCGSSCIDAMAEGWILTGDLRPRCLRWLVASLDQAAGRKLDWHPTHMQMAGKMPCP